MFKCPRITMPFHMLVDNLLTRDIKKIAKHLGVSPPTVQRWIKDDSAPASVRIALFWETKWGVSQLYTEAYNGQAVHYANAKALERQIETLKKRIAYLEATADFGAANASVFEKT